MHIKLSNIRGIFQSEYSRPGVLFTVIVMSLLKFDSLSNIHAVMAPCMSVRSRNYNVEHFYIAETLGLWVSSAAVARSSKGRLTRSPHCSLLLPTSSFSKHHATQENASGHQTSNYRTQAPHPCYKKQIGLTDFQIG